jgi:pimeloyl-ACP methyl ester carboxylesterase
MRWILALLLAGVLFTLGAPAAHALAQSERTARNRGISLHYVVRGPAQGQPVVLLHGFPDFSATWDGLTTVLAGRGYRTIALDLRGYNGSSAPEGVQNYAFPALISDVDAVLAAEQISSPVALVGHDWGAAIAWQYAFARPERVGRLVILSVPHPRGFAREMAANAAQQRNSEYARNFQRPGAESQLTAEGLAQWVGESDRARYVAAFRRSNFAAMLNYYRANYPADMGASLAERAAALDRLAPVQAPVLIVHGLNDQALQAAGHAGTWNWVARDTTLLMIPGAGHWVHHEAADMVNGAILDWLERRRPK